MGGTDTIVLATAGSRPIVGVKDETVANIHDEFTARPVHIVAEDRAVVGDTNKDACPSALGVENHGPNLGTMPTALVTGDHQSLDGNVLDADLTTANSICVGPDAKINLVGRLAIGGATRTAQKGLDSKGVEVGGAIPCLGC